MTAVRFMTGLVGINLQESWPSYLPTPCMLQAKRNRVWHSFQRFSKLVMATFCLITCHFHNSQFIRTVAVCSAE